MEQTVTLRFTLSRTGSTTLQGEDFSYNHFVLRKEAPFLAYYLISWEKYTVNILINNHKKLPQKIDIIDFDPSYTRFQIQLFDK